MKLLHQCIVFGALVVSVAACGNESPWSGSANGEGGRISLQLSTDVSVHTSTRAGDAESPVKPDGDLFRIKLESTDASYSKEWETLPKFNAEDGFPRGSYIITASYGTEKKQGFTNPYYVGSSDVNVVTGETTETVITASLANSMVSVRYTDSFLKVFSQYHATVSSASAPGSEDVVFAKDEKRPAYVAPGQVTVSFTLSNPEGQEVTVAPSRFTAIPKRHYIVTANVEETEVKGVYALDIQFEEDVVHENFEIVISDELFSSPAPEITAEGFTSGGLIETYEGVTIENSPEIHVSAQSGIQSAVFKVETADAGNTPLFGNSLDLVAADPSQQSLINQSGLVTYGFFRKPVAGETGKGEINRMGIIEMKKFIEKLKPGEYTISLKVTDNLGRESSSETPMSFTARVEAVNYSIAQDVLPKFMGNELTLLVSANYYGAKDRIIFKNGDDAELTVKSIETLTEENSALPYANKYRYTLQCPQLDDTQTKVKAYYPNKSEHKELTLGVAVPQYTIDTDAFAYKAYVRINAQSDSDREIVMRNMHLYDNGHRVAVAEADKDYSTGIITIQKTYNSQNNKLTPGQTYSMSLTLGSSQERDKKEFSFTTEADSQVPNGDFEELRKTIDNVTIEQGGKYTRVLIMGGDMQNHQTFTVREPVGWVSVNSKTCDTGASPCNSWFVIPAVYSNQIDWTGTVDTQGGMGGQKDTPSYYRKENNPAQSGSSAMIIRNVAWSHNGTLPGTHKKTAGSSGYYNEHAPNSFSNRSAGKLVLGSSYSYENGVDKFVEGADFSSRPSKLTGYYRYEPDSQDSGEKAVVRLAFMNGENVLCEKTVELNVSDVYRQFEIPVTWDLFGNKTTRLKISICSSNRSENDIKTTNVATLHEQESRGAKLTVDNLQFEY